MYSVHSEGVYVKTLRHEKLAQIQTNKGGLNFLN